MALNDLFLLTASAALLGSQMVPQKYLRGLGGLGFHTAMSAGITLAALGAPGPLPPPASSLGLSLAAGLLWAAGNLLLLQAVYRVGISRAFLLFSPTSAIQYLAGVGLRGETGALHLLPILGVAMVTGGAVLAALARPPQAAGGSRVGVVCGLLSNVFFGFFMLPLLDGVALGGPRVGVLGLGLGGLLLAPAAAMVLRARPRLPSVRDGGLALGSGVMWGAALTLSLLVIPRIGLSIGAPLLNGLLLTVSTLWGVVVFREVGRDPRRIGLVALACLLSIAGAALLAPAG